MPCIKLKFTSSADLAHTKDPAQLKDLDPFAQRSVILCNFDPWCWTWMRSASYRACRGTCRSWRPSRRRPAGRWRPSPGPRCREALRKATCWLAGRPTSSGRMHCPIFLLSFSSLSSPSSYILMYLCMYTDRVVHLVDATFCWHWKKCCAFQKFILQRNF